MSPSTGFCVWFTGLCGSGKTTLGRALAERLRARGLEVAVLDGDEARRTISAGLGFSRADRDENVMRIGAAAREIVGRGGVAVCAAVSPYQAARERVRDLVGRERFILVYCDAPLAVCEARDPKGLYARARRGELRGFTGVDDPYEPPRDAEVVVDTDALPPEACIRRVVQSLEARGGGLISGAAP